MCFHIADARQGALGGAQSGLGLLIIRSVSGHLALLQAEAFALHFQDMHMVGQAVEDGACQALGTEDLGPFVERRVI